MATFSGSQGLPLQLEISHLNEVLVLLRKCQFPDKRWFELGLALGLSKNTLDTIKANNPQDVNQCLIECLSKWLKRADDVNSKGTTYVSLSAAIRDMNEIAVAENIEKEKCPEVLAVHIFNKHLPLLSKSLSDPVNVARLLYGEHVITQQKLHSVEDDGLSLSDKRQVLLAAVKDAIQADHVALQKFSIVLCHLTCNVKLGENALTDYKIYFPSDKETVIIKVHEALSSTESSDAVSHTPKPVEVAIHRSMSEEFTTLRSSYATMSYNVRKAIKDANIDLEDLKDFIISMDNKLEKKLEQCENISSTLRLIDKECSLVDIELFCAVVKNFQIETADKHIKEYRDASTKYFQSNSIAGFLKEKLEASATCPSSLQCETVTYVFDWKPDETKLDDIKDILSKTSGKLVKIKYADTDESISVTCSFPYHLTGVLITQLMDNLQFLKKNDLKKLTIGYWIMWEREGKEEKETEQLLEDKETKISLKERYQKEDRLEKKGNDEEQQAEAEKELFLKHDGSAHADLRKGMAMELEKLQHLLKTNETASLESKKEIEMLQEKISLLSVQLLDKEKETEVLAENNRLLKSKLHQSDHTSSDTWHEVGVQVDSGDINEVTLYTGMMYHEKKEVNEWMTTFSVVRDLQVLQHYLKHKHPEAEQDGPFVIFKYNQPDGILQLHLQDTPSFESGWAVHPVQSPMEIRQYVVDEFIDNPMCSSIHISVHAEIGVAKKSLHCPIELIGIDPSVIIYINRTPPLMIDSTSLSSSTASISETRRETEEGTFRSDIAHRVMTECTGMIKERLDLNTCSLVDRLLEKRIINEKQKNHITDQSCGLTANQRMDELLSLVKASIREDGEDFGLFLEIIKEENTRRADRLAQTLLDNYKRLL